VKFFYLVVLGLLIVAFFSGKIVTDLRQGNCLLASISAVIGIATLVFFTGYAFGSIKNDRAAAIVPNK
jgi:hypothetical protein